MLQQTIADLAEGPTRAQAKGLLASLSMAVGDFRDAAEQLKDALGETGDVLADVRDAHVCHAQRRPRRRRGTEIFLAAFMPDAAEALIALRRLDDAESLIEELQRNGRRLDRAWMSAVGARCRSMLLAAQGDIEAARLAAEEAVTHHDRLPMPFERARTLLYLGQLQRRQRRRAAAVALGEALSAFERMGTPLWADRAH